jgi:hypothetical protein
MGPDRNTRAVMKLSPADNVVVALRTLKAGESIAIEGVIVTLPRGVAVGHKVAARAIAPARSSSVRSDRHRDAGDRAGRARAHAQPAERVPATAYTLAMTLRRHVLVPGLPR